MIKTCTSKFIIFFTLLVFQSLLAENQGIASSFEAAIYEPSQVATIVFDGINGGGSDSEGEVGIDEDNSVVTNLASLIGLPIGLNHPAARNQITLGRFYGDSYPAYY